MPKKTARIILDTNLGISFLITKNLSPLDPLLISGQIKLLFSEDLLTEFVEVIQRTKFKKYFSRSEIDELFITIGSYAEFISVKTEVNICRDPKDNFLLCLAIDGQVNYLITGDQDLLTLKEIGTAKIITISDFFVAQGRK